MSFLDFGKRKDRNVDEFVLDKSSIDMRNDEDRANTKEDDLEEDMKIEDVEISDQEDIEDYIDPDDLDYEQYEDIVDTIENNGWHRISPMTHSISNFDTEMVVAKSVRMNTSGNVLEITCPPERIITICGSKESDIDLEDFYRSPNLHDTPHFFTVQCADNDNVNISPNTILSIWKVTKDGMFEKYCQEFYGDLSPLYENGMLKSKEKRHYFPTTIILQSDEMLTVEVHNPQRDVSKTSILAMADIFAKDEVEEDEE